MKPETETERGQRWANYFRPANGIDNPAPHTHEGRARLMDARRIAKWENTRNQVETVSTGEPSAIDGQKGQEEVSHSIFLQEVSCPDEEVDFQGEPAANEWVARILDALPVFLLPIAAFALYAIVLALRP